MESYQRLGGWIDLICARVFYNSSVLDNFIAAGQLIPLIPCHLYKAYRLDLLSVWTAERELAVPLSLQISYVCSVICNSSYKYRLNDEVCSAYLSGFDY